jgi:hypothetical protein
MAEIKKEKMSSAGDLNFGVSLLDIIGAGSYG